MYQNLQEMNNINFIDISDVLSFYDDQSNEKYNEPIRLAENILDEKCKEIVGFLEGSALILNENSFTISNSDTYSKTIES